MKTIDRKNTVLTELELKILITESCRENYLEVNFGGKLVDRPSNDWAFKRIKDIRNI
jgi:hypothetical protein